MKKALEPLDAYDPTIDAYALPPIPPAETTVTGFTGAVLLSKSEPLNAKMGESPLPTDATLLLEELGILDKLGVLEAPPKEEELDVLESLLLPGPALLLPPAFGSKAVALAARAVAVSSNRISSMLRS